MPKKTIGPRLSEASMEFYDTHFDTRNAGAEYALEMFPALYRGTLRELRGKFTAAELSAILDVVNSLLLMPKIAGQHLLTDISDGIVLDGLNEKWGFDGPTILDKLNACPLFHVAILEIWAKAFWVQNNRDNAQDLDRWTSHLT